MSVLKFYYDLFSQPSRALYIFLKIANIPFEAKPIKIIKLEHTTPEFEAINPFKKVPIIEHNDFKLTESIAIARYLCREYKIPQHWYPFSSREQAKVDEYLEWQHLNTRLKCASYFAVTFLNPLQTGKSAKPEQIEKYKAQMLGCLDLIENIWLKDKLFLTGNKINISDIFGACELEQIRLTGYDLRAEWPRINVWMERVQQETRPYYDEAHKLLNKFIKQQDQAASRKIILVSSCINGHIKFWDLESKELIKKDHGKLLSTSQSYCYTVIKNTLIVQGCVPRTLYELPVDEIVAGAADGNKLAEGEEVFITEFVKPPKLYIRDYYMFTNIAVCITEHGHLGFSIHGGKWKFHNILPIFHGTPTAVLVYAHLLVLGLNSGHVCIYCVENWNILDLNSTLARLIILDTEPIISLNISAHFKERIIAASIKRVHFIHFT
ncbi:glutathione S-transferase theta-3-like isoform X2 [Vespa crabro]|uniref:glutathione S-transferase theta-3-like isoform X2 n=1 Tax=Vespa crabro TaxID=7445 RepID=UPI001EFF7FAB|nr:glutathione S-transferase theta-3-like isoform X2 [Vespa crabro]